MFFNFDAEKQKQYNIKLCNLLIHIGGGTYNYPIVSHKAVCIIKHKDIRNIRRPVVLTTGLFYIYSVQGARYRVNDLLAMHQI